MDKAELILLTVMVISFALLILNVALLLAFKSKYDSLLNAVLSAVLSSVCIFSFCSADLSKYSAFFAFMSIVCCVMNILTEFLLRKAIHKAFKSILQKHGNVKISSGIYITNKEICVADHNEVLVLNLTDSSEDTVFEKSVDASHQKVLRLMKRNYYFRLF